MTPMPGLETALLDILHAIANSEIRLIVGGGFGIFLKTACLRRSGARTLFSERPESRSTNDIDLFLAAELLIHSEKLKPLALALGDLGYRAVIGAEKYQFFKPGPGGGAAGGVKIDILTGPQEFFASSAAKVDTRRVRPRPEIGIHAHPVDEAPTLELGLVAAPLAGHLSSGAPWQGGVFIPHPFTFLMMKLFAFQDRFNDLDKDYGRHHALDLYSILAATTEAEWDFALELRDRFRAHPCVIRAGAIVAESFSRLDGMGMVRLRESPNYAPGLDLNGFISALAELFPLKSD